MPAMICKKSVIAVLVVLLTFSVFAEDKKDEDKKDDRKDVFKAGEIVVTGKRKKGTIERASTSTVITDEDIERKGAATLDEALEGIPGVQVYTHTKGHKRIRMRGFDQEKVFIMVDGVPFNDIYATDVDLSIIPVSSIAKIVVNRGVSSALYGTDGAIGSVNVITKKPDKLTAKVKAQVGSWNNANYALSHGMPLGDLYYWLTGSVQTSNGFKPSGKLDYNLRKQWYNKLLRYDRYGVTFDDILNPSKDQYLEDDGKWDHQEFNKYNAGLKLGWAPIKTVEVGVSSSFHYHEMKSNTYQNNCFSDYDAAQEIWKNDRRPAFHDDPAYAKDWILRNRSFVYPEVWSVKVSPYVLVSTEKFDMSFSTWYYHALQVQEGYADNEHLYAKDISAIYGSRSTADLDPFLDIKTQQSYGFRLLPSFKLSKKYKVNLMAHWRDEYFKAQEQAISAEKSPNILEKMGKDPFDVRDLRAQYVSLAIEDELKIGSFRSTLGVSWDAQSFERFFQRDEMDFEEAYIPKDKSRVWGTRDSFNPVVSTMFDPVKNKFRLRTAFSKKTRFPNLNEYSKIASLDMDTGSLKPENSYNLNSGFELFFFDRNVRFRSDYFLSMIKDRIAKVNKEEAPMNVEKTVVQGLESSLKIEFENIFGFMDLHTDVMYTFLHSRNYDDSPEEQVNKGKYIEFSPEHQLIFNFRLDFNTGNKMFPETEFLFWGEATFGELVYVMKEAPENDAPFSTDYFETATLHNPVMLNLKLTQQVWDYFKVWFVVKNLLDDYNSDPFNPGPGRSFYGGVSFEYE